MSMNCRHSPGPYELHCETVESPATREKKLITWNSLPHRRSRESTARISCSVPAKLTIARLVGRGPAQNWLACTPTERSRKAKSGSRQVLWAAFLKAPYE